MNIYVSDDAAKWYEEELDVANGDSVRFYVRYGGNSTIQSGFSLGVQVESPESAAASITKNGINYFIEEIDVWYFDSHDLYISMDDALNEPVFAYK